MQRVAWCRGTRQAGHANAGVLRSAERIGGVERAVGAGQNGVVAVHNRLHFGRGVGHVGVDGRAVQSAVDGGQVARGATGDAGHCCRNVVGHGEGHPPVFSIGVVVLSRSADLEQGRAHSAQHAVHQALELTLGVYGVGVGQGLDGRLHSGQVGRGDARDVQGLQVGQGGGGCAHGAHVSHDVLGRVGHGLQLGHAVHIAHVALVHRAAEQAQGSAYSRRARGQACHAHGGKHVARQSGVTVGPTIGVGQDGFVAVHNGLHLECGVGLGIADGGAVQGAVDGGQVGGVYTGHARSSVSGRTDGAVGGITRCGNVVERCVLDGGQRRGDDVVDDICHQRLQFKASIDARVGGEFEGVLNGGQVGGSHIGVAQEQVQVLRAGADAGAGVGGQLHDAGSGIGQGLHLGCGVHGGLAGPVGHIVQQLQGGAVCGHARHARHANGKVLRGRDRRAAASAVCTAQDGVEGVHDGLHFGQGVGARAVNGGAVERAVDRGEVVIGVYTGDACRRVAGGGQGGGGVVGLSGRSNGVERGFTEHGVDQGLQLELRIHCRWGAHGLDGRLHCGQLG